MIEKMMSSNKENSMPLKASDYSTQPKVVTKLAPLEKVPS